MNIVLLTERICGLFFRSARSHSKTAPKSSLGLVSFASMILSWGEFQGKRILFRKVGNPGEMVNIVLLTERICGLLFRSARSLSKTAPKSSLGLVSFASMILSWGEFQGKRILFRKVGNLGEMGTIGLSIGRIWGLFFRSARSLSKTAPKSSLGPVGFTGMIFCSAIGADTL